MWLRLLIIIMLLAPATSAGSRETYSCDLIKLEMRESEVYEILDSNGIEYSYYSENTTTTLASNFIHFGRNLGRNIFGVRSDMITTIGFADGNVVHISCDIIYTLL